MFIDGDDEHNKRELANIVNENIAEYNGFHWLDQKEETPSLNLKLYKLVEEELSSNLFKLFTAETDIPRLMERLHLSDVPIKEDFEKFVKEIRWNVEFPYFIVSISRLINSYIILRGGIGKLPKAKDIEALVDFCLKQPIKVFYQDLKVDKSCR